MQETKAAGKEDDISGVSLVLSQYIKDTGDLDGVMDFLRTMVSSGKLSESDGLTYIARVINNLQGIKSPYSHHEVEPAQTLRHHIQANYTSQPWQHSLLVSGNNPRKMIKISLQKRLS